MSEDDFNLLRSELTSERVEHPCLIGTDDWLSAINKERERRAPRARRKQRMAALLNLLSDEQLEAATDAVLAHMSDEAKRFAAQAGLSTEGDWTPYCFGRGPVPA